MTKEGERLEDLVRDSLGEALGVRVRSRRAAPSVDPVCDPACPPRAVPPARPVNEAALARIARATPARLAQGRAGTRYLTDVYVGLRAEHAVAIDAVHSEVPDDFAARLGCVALRSQAQGKEEFLLHPERGRRLDDASRTKLLAEGTRGADVQVILGDGLAAWAILRQGEALLPALLRELASVGLRAGKPLFVRYARIGVQDEIGVLTEARSTVILVGERPGLGTGDSLSMYTAFGPKLGQDNAEKNCISNIRPLGLPPERAARDCALLMRRTFDAGGGGLHLVRPVRDVVVRERAP